MGEDGKAAMPNPNTQKKVKKSLLRFRPISEVDTLVPKKWISMVPRIDIPVNIHYLIFAIELLLLS